MMYYYEHTNGTIIEKPDYVVDTWGPPEEYFNSSKCVRWWYEGEATKETVKKFKRGVPGHD